MFEKSSITDCITEGILLCVIKDRDKYMLRKMKANLNSKKPEDHRL